MSSIPPVLRAPARRATSAQGRRRRGRALLCWSAVAVIIMATLSVASPAQAATGNRIVLGAVGDYQGLARSTGAPMAEHTYAYFTGGVPQADYITVRYSGLTWRQVASAAPGSTVYNNIVRWAQTIRSRGPIMMGYHHEPEQKQNVNTGSPSDFIAAWRKVVSIFNAQGATNVTWIWQMTPYAFDVNSSDRRYAAKWYPGDDYVDVVGSDAYAWGTCYGMGNRGAWRDLGAIVANSVAFARAHGKKVSLPELGAAPTSQRPGWLQNAHQYLAANKSIFQSVFYFQVAPRGGGCPWRLTTSADYSAYGAMARDTANFTS
jgi:hypothetical protein